MMQITDASVLGSFVNTQQITMSPKRLEMRLGNNKTRLNLATWKLHLGKDNSKSRYSLGQGNLDHTGAKGDPGAYSGWQMRRGFKICQWQPKTHLVLACLSSDQDN